MSLPSSSTVLPIVEPAEAGFSADRVRWIADALKREVAAGRLPGAVVAAARGGRMLAPIVVGYRDAAARSPIAVDAVFSIASMTKPMTSVAILQLVEQGHVLLGDPVGKYLPQLAEFRVAVLSEDDRPLTVPARRQPTIQDFLRHTSGLTYRDRGRTFAHRATPGSSISAPAALTREAFLGKLSETPLLFEPGTDWEYGFSTDVLGLVVEAVTKQKLSDVLRRMVWEPLGLTDCGFELTAEQTERYALALPTDPLTGAAQSVHHAPPQARHLWESGGGGALATASDYLRFAEMLRQGGQLGEARVLGRKTVKLMTADHLGTEIRSRIADSMDPAAAGYGFGLGVAVRRQDGVAAMPGSTGDFYWSGVYGTYFWVDPAEQLSVVLMAAVPGLLRLRYRQLIRALVYQALR